MGILKHLQSQGVTIVISTHDLGLLNQVMDKVYFVENGEIAESFDALSDALLTKPKISSFIGKS